MIHYEDANQNAATAATSLNRRGSGPVSELLLLAQVQALLAIADAITTHNRPAGACPWYIKDDRPDHTTSHIPCRFLDQHTGIHANDPDLCDGFTIRWTDRAEGAGRVDQEQQ